MGFVPENGLVYYRLFVPQGESALVVSCSSLNDGDPDIYIKKGHNRPSVNAFDYGSQGFKSDQLVIQDADVGGEYVVAVYGYTEAVYSLVYSYGSYNYFKIYAG